MIGLVDRKIMTSRRAEIFEACLLVCVSGTKRR